MSDNEDDAYEPRDRASIQRVQLRDVQVERFELAKSRLASAHESYRREKRRLDALQEVLKKSLNFLMMLTDHAKMINFELHCPDLPSLSPGTRGCG